MGLPGKGEKLRIVGDVAGVNDDAQVQKALRRLTAEMAPTSLTQLVMWRLAGRLDWETIGELSRELGQRVRIDPGEGFRGASRRVA